MANFIVQFPLKTEKYQEDILNKRFEIGRKIYNSLVNVTQKRYKEMMKTYSIAKGHDPYSFQCGKIPFPCNGKVIHPCNTVFKAA